MDTHSSYVAISNREFWDSINAAGGDIASSIYGGTIGHAWGRDIVPYDELPDLSKDKTMRSEIRRLETFNVEKVIKHCDENGYSHAEMAHVGFYFRSRTILPDRVECFYCGKGVGLGAGEWKGNTPFSLHKKLNSCCPYLPFVISQSLRVQESENAPGVASLLGRFEEAAHESVAQRQLTENSEFPNFVENWFSLSQAQRSSYENPKPQAGGVNKNSTGDPWLIKRESVGDTVESMGYTRSDFYQFIDEYISVPNESYMSIKEISHEEIVGIYLAQVEQASIGDVNAPLSTPLQGDHEDFQGPQNDRQQEAAVVSAGEGDQSIISRLENIGVYSHQGDEGGHTNIVQREVSGAEGGEEYQAKDFSFEGLEGNIQNFMKALIERNEDPNPGVVSNVINRFEKKNNRRPETDDEFMDEYFNVE